MSEEEIVSSVLEGFLKIKDFIDNSDVEISLKKDSRKAGVVKKSKEFVDELFELSKNVKDNFYEHYNKLHEEDQIQESEKDDTSVPNQILTNGLDSSTSTSNESVTENVENSKVVNENIGNTDSSEVIEETDNSQIEDAAGKVTDAEDMDILQNEDITEKMDTSQNEVVDPETKLDSNKENESDPQNKTSMNSEPDEEKQSVKIENSEEPPRKSLIRLVDLNKLIDPKQKKSVKFDSSVIILTSSDEETNVTKSDKNSSLKSNKSSSKSTNKSKHKDSSDSDLDSDKTVEAKKSDSEPEDLGRKSRRLRNLVKDKAKTREKLKTIFKRSTNKSFEIINKKGKASAASKKSDEVEVISDSISDSDDEKSRKSARTRMSRRCKSDDVKLNSKVSDRLESIRRSKRTRNSTENASSSDTEKSQKKKSRTGRTSKDSETVHQSDEEKSTKKKLLRTRKTSNDKNSNKDADSDEDKSNKKKLRTKKGSAGDEKSDSEDDEKASKKKSRTRKGTTNEGNSDSEDEEKSDKKKLKQQKENTDSEDDGKSDKKNLKKKNSEDEEKSKKSLLRTKKGAANEENAADEEKSKKISLRTTRRNKTNEDNADGKNKSDAEKSAGTENGKDENSETEKSQKKSESKKGTTEERSDAEVKSDKENPQKTSKAKKGGSQNSDVEKDNEKSENENSKSKKDDSSDEDVVSSSSKSKNDVKKTKSSTNEDSSKDSDEECSKTDPKKSKTDKKIDMNSSDSDDEVSNKKRSKTAADESKDTSSKQTQGKEAKTKKTCESSESDDDKSTTRGSSDEDDDDEKGKSAKNKKGDNSDGSDAEKSIEDEKKAKKNARAIYTSSDSDEEFGAYSRKKDKSNKELLKKAKKKTKKAVVSDSDESDTDKKNKKEDSDSDASQESTSSKDSKKSSDNEKGEDTKKTSRRRIKKTKESSDSDEEVSTRKKIRDVLGKDSLSETTKQAEADEKERKARIAEKQKKYNRLFEEKIDAKIDKVVLDYSEKTKEPVLEVHKKIVKNLKPHQASGIQFMYDACFESVERMKKSEGSGCILAHCMGLGKTLQVIALVHTLLTKSDKTKVEKIMVVCPINTVLNWKAEFKKWMPSNSQVEVYELATSKKNYERQYIVKEWHDDGGVLILGYHMFRNLSNPNNRRITKKMRMAFQEGMVDPGPDLVVCDEGHLLKNEKTHLSIAMNRIKTARRIVLTGTPLQNNLKEYWCMVQFIKPNLLGTYKEYMNRFVNPITNGQYTDSTQHDIVLMRKRSHVLHKLLDGVVQRRDYAVLEPYLPPKQEYVIFVKLSETQIKMYKHYMERYARQNDGSNRTSFLFTDFQNLQRMCTHPRVMLDKTSEKKEKWSDEEESEGSLKDFIDDGEASASTSNSSSSSSGSGSEDGSDGSGSDKKKKKKKSKTTSKSRVTRARAAERKENNEEDSEPEIVETVSKQWWQEFCDGDELDNIKNSGKLSLLFEILKECEEIGDKILVFSQSLYSLNCIEYFLKRIDDATQAGDAEKLGGYKGTWEIGLDYFRIDGSSSCDNRAYWCDSFNNPDNIRARLFLISTRAGGLGINLVAANRVIIFDVSWNPSHDVQSIYRVYRFGQIKPCYVYRFVTYGAMEMKIYERQVTKQAISKRVIDEQQIDRHYNQNDLQELYKCDLEPTERPLPMVPKDVLLGEMLQKYENIIYKYHLHQSLLENKQDECLNEEERKAAWDEFENEKVLRKTHVNPTSYFGQVMQGVPGIQGMSAQVINAALMNIVRRDNPTWSEHQIKGIIPALVRQLQVQIEEQDMSMYQRVVQEIQIMNQAKLKESLYQQQVMKMYQQQYILQKQQQAVLGNLQINPQTLQNMYGGPANFYVGNRQFVNGPSTSSTPRRPTNDVIELND